MGKQRKHANVHGKGGGHGSIRHTVRTKKPERARTVSTDAGAVIVDSPLYLTLYTSGILALMYILKLIIQ